MIDSCSVSSLATSYSFTNNNTNKDKDTTLSYHNLIICFGNQQYDCQVRDEQLYEIQGRLKKLHEQRQSAVVSSKEEHQPQIHQQQSDIGRPRMAFEPSTENHQSLGLGSYMLAGVGVAMGVTLVGAIFGGIG